MKGKYQKIAGSHAASEYCSLQIFIKYCSQDGDSVFEELRRQLITLACNTCAINLVKKILDNVIDHVHQLGNASQKQTLLLELYLTELQFLRIWFQQKSRWAIGGAGGVVWPK
ncbi:PREDICTED: uncharacterized protein LOC104588999 isoform X2 [Nelumbo nucifera]|uniref:Uncharacterized protein LOC104588999 isoform X2 n=1 Tax=Nelumbo nucifera TaxID=4432 RepID=A0A1U8PZ19_NELNU|nr:PREDICTED: uncharacterized protein LOC104588999 isoform X2 [Nelumbo nucifera]